MNGNKYRRHLEVCDKWSLNDTYEKLRSDYRVNLTIKVLAIMGYAFRDELSTYDIASFLGVNESSITGWVKIWNGKGLEGLANRTLLKKRGRELNKIFDEAIKESGYKLEQAEDGHLPEGHHPEDI